MEHFLGESGNANLAGQFRPPSFYYGLPDATISAKFSESLDTRISLEQQAPFLYDIQTAGKYSCLVRLNVQTKKTECVRFTDLVF
jgi:hypothetical protein